MTEIESSSPLFCGIQAYSAIGGIQRFDRHVVKALSEIQSDRGRQPPVVSFLRDASVPEPPRPDAEFLFFAGNRARFLWQSVTRAIRNAEILIIDHINLLPLAAMVRIVRPRLPIVMFAHGVEVWDDPQFHRKRPYEPALVRFAVDRVAAVSAYTAEMMGTHYGIPRNRFVIFPCAVDPIADTADRTDRRRPTVLTVTRLDERERSKNIDKLIAAVAQLRTRCPELTCEIVGDGPLRAELEQLAGQLGVADRVKFLGRATDAELAAAYQRATVFALPSSKEGFGIVFLEAWLRRLPVICSSHGGAAYIVDNGVNGIAIDPEDPTALSTAIFWLVTNKQIADQLANAGLLKTRTMFLHEHFRGRLRDLLRELLPRSSAA